MGFLHDIRKRRLKYLINQYEEEAQILEMQEKIRRHRRKYKRQETSKLVLWFMLFLLLAIVVFTGYATLHMMTVVTLIGGALDFTPLVALISAIVGQVIITLGYFAKSTKENSEGGVTYLAAQNQMENSIIYQDLDK